MLTPEQIDRVFVALLATNARQADVQTVQMLGGTPEVLAEYIWDHWLAEPEEPTRSRIESLVELALEGRPTGC